MSVNLRKRIKTDIVLYYGMLHNVKFKKKTAGVSSILPQRRKRLRVCISTKICFRSGSLSFGSPTVSRKARKTFSHRCYHRIVNLIAIVTYKQ